jgi:CDP-paratose 2-epimerase
MANKILITGGAGFVGSNMALHLKEKFPESEISVLDNLSRKGSHLNLPLLKAQNIEFIQGDIRDREDLEFNLMVDCSANPSVLAGIDSPEEVIQNNLVGTLNCLEQVRKNKAGLLFLSTSRVYSIPDLSSLSIKEQSSRFELTSPFSIPGVSQEGISEEFSTSGHRSFYGSTKLASELMIQEYIQSGMIKGVINRCGVIAGPRQMGKMDQGIISFWLSKYVFGGDLSYIGFNGSGKQVRDILHISDLCNLVEEQIKHIDKHNGQIYNVGGGKENATSLRDLSDTCESITGILKHISVVEATRQYDIPIYITDNSKITRGSNWKPTRSVEDTVQDTYDWMMSNKQDLYPIFNS